MWDIPMPTELPTTERDLLMLSLRLMLILIFFMVDMDMDTLDMPDTTDTHMLMDMLTTESALLMPSPRPMLTLAFCAEDTDMDTLDTVDTTDTHMVDMPTTISYNTKAISCYRKLTKLPSMSSSSVTTFFSAWTLFGSYSRKQRESKYEEINNEIHSAL